MHRGNRFAYKKRNSKSIQGIADSAFAVVSRKCARFAVAAHQSAVLRLGVGNYVATNARGGGARVL